MIKPSKIEAFVQALKETSASKKWGFNKLAQREDILSFFDELKKQGLFTSSENPAPAQASSGGYYIPYWEALTYLEPATLAAAKQKNQVVLSEIKSIIISVTKFSQEHDEKGITNFSTWHFFTKILAFFPSDQILAEDIKLIEHWLECVFDTSLVVHEITKKFLPKIMEGEKEHAKILIKELFPILLGSDHVEEKGDLGTFWGKERPHVETYWLNDFFKTHAEKMGSIYGDIVVPILVFKLDGILTEEVNTYSFHRRPAIEDHQQNHHDHAFETVLITALRNVLTAFAAARASDAVGCVKNLLSSKHTILNRVGWHIIDILFSQYKAIFVERLSPEIFSRDVWHEMYLLLRNNFSSLTDVEKNKVFESIQSIRIPGERPDDERREYKEHVERDWLSAIYNKGSEKVDARFSELMSKRELGGLRDHPEFISYHETFFGQPPAPISAEDLLGMRHDKLDAIRIFNDFEPKNGWREPTYRSFADVLGLAVQKEPEFFLEDVDAFLTLKIPYLYGLVSGLKNVKLGQVLSGWQRALGLCSKIVGDNTFWLETTDEEKSFDRPNREWVLGAICDLLDSGVKIDETAFDAVLLPKAKIIINTILDKTKPDKDVNIQDAMTYALNTTRGRCLGVLFNFSLRSARVADKEQGSHEQLWQDLQPIFERELEKCKDDNYEFSTYCGAYLPNLLYLSKDWLLNNLDRIFPAENPNNRSCALQGFSFVGHYNDELYKLLSKKVFLPALIKDDLNEGTRRRLLQLATLSYLRGNEGLTEADGVFGSIISNFRKEDITEIAWFLYHLRDETMKEEQILRVMAFWKTCCNKTKGNEEEYGIVLSNLSRLIVYVSGTKEDELALLEDVARFVGKNHNGPTFIKGLSRVAINNPSAAGGFLLTLAQNEVYMYDKEDVVSILNVLVAQDRNLYKRVCDKLKKYDWVMEHYRELRMS